METNGRERRHRYFTAASYRELVTKEKLDNATEEVDFSNVGGFALVDPALFYDDRTSLFQYQDVFKDNVRELTGKGRKRPLKNPILPDGSIKQGRPRKYPVGEDPKALRKRKREEAKAAAEVEPPPKKKRRVVTPRAKKGSAVATSAVAGASAAPDTAAAAPNTAAAPDTTAALDTTIALDMTVALDTAAAPDAEELGPSALKNTLLLLNQPYSNALFPGNSDV